MPNSILSERQKQILLLLSIEWKELAIAEELLVSVDTVHGDRIEMYRLLGVHTIQSAIVVAQLMGEVTLEEFNNIRYLYGLETYPLRTSENV